MRPKFTTSVQLIAEINQYYNS